MADNFDNYSMKVQARVDMPSNKDIDAQIRKLEKSISKLKVSGQFDDTALKNLTNQLNSLKATVSTANFSPTALTELTNQVNKALQNINIGNINVGNIGNQAQQVGQQIGQQINQGVTKHIDVNSAIEKAYNKYLSLTGKKSSAIFKGQLNEISSVLQNDIKLFEKFNSSIDSIDDAGLLRETVNELSNIKTEATSLAKTTDTLSNSINHSLNLDTTSAQEEIKEIITITDNYGRELDELNSKLLSTSKMMNTQGKLITLFHGSPNEFDSFKINNRGRFEDALGVGGYFFDNPSDSIGYGNVSQWFANVEKIFDTSAKLSAEEIQSVYDKYKTQIKDILDIDNLLDFTSDVNKNPIDSLKNLSSRMGFDSSFLMKELGYDAIIDRGATSTYVILDENKIIKANSALKEQVSLITDIQEAKKMEENADPKRNWNKSVMDAMKAKSESSKQEISLSNSSTSTVIQNEEKKQQAIQETENKIKGLSELKITPDNAIDINGLTKAEDILDKVRTKYEQFGQVTFKNIELDADGNLKSFRVNIQQTNGDLKETRNFLMEISDDAKKVKFADDTIKGTENVVRHLNEQKDATDEIIKEEQKLANAMADVREKSEQARQAEEKRQELAQNKAINKALEEEYNQKQKIIAQDEKLAQATAKRADEIQLSMGVNGDTTSKIEVLRNNFTKLGLSADEVKTKMSGVDTEVKILQSLMNSGADNSAIVTQFEKLQTVLTQTQNNLKQTRSDYSLLATEQQRLSLANTIEAWNQKNTAATRAVREENERYVVSLRDLNNQMTKIDFNKINTGFKQNENSMRALNRLGASLKNQWVQATQSFTMWLSASRLVMAVMTKLRQMPQTVKELDTSLVDLKKTTSMTTSQLEDFYYAANDVAKQMGVTTKEIIDQASAWSRLGYSSQEAATKMAKYSSMFASISPGMDVDTATNGLVSIMKAFDIGNDNPDDVLDGIMSKVNIIGNTAATSNAEIVNMLSKSSSAMKEANNTLEETIALETAAVEITRDDDSVGTAFKTLSMRIRGYDEQTESYTNNVEELSGKIADLTKTASTPGGISLFTDDAKTEFKSTYQLLSEISKVYDQLDDKTQAQLLEALAGISFYPYVQKCA